MQSTAVAAQDESEGRGTREAYEDLLIAYKHFNDELFESKLPGAIITLQRNKRFLGYFSRKRWVSAKTTAVADEIAMNPAVFAVRPIESVLSTLCHEQAHQYQYHFGKPGRRGYHNREFAELLKKVGLQASNTGRPGGKEVGEQMTHFILPDGAFLKSVKRLLETNFTLSWLDRYPMRIAEQELLPSDEDLRAYYPDDYTGGEGDDEKVGSNLPPPLLAPVLGSDGITPLATSDQGEPVATGLEEAGAEGAEGRAPPVAMIPEPLKPKALSKPPSLTGLDIEVPKGVSSQQVKKPTRYKFVCPGCEDAAWGKGTLKLVCGKCAQPMRSGELDAQNEIDQRNKPADGDD